eukprot:XP_014057566.1 PREDICTED: uncharacterized protein LOC106606023 isoform X1 [Salmo salar]
MSQVAHKVGLCNINILCLAFIFCLIKPVYAKPTPANVFASSSSLEYMTLINPVRNNLDVTTPKLTHFVNTLLGQFESLLGKDGTSPGNLDQVTQGYPGPHTNAKDPQGLVKSLMSVLQTYKKQTASQGNDHVFKLWGKAPKTKKSTNEIKPRVNILTDPTYSEPLVKVNMILGLFFYGFIMIVFIYDSVRVSMEARRRSDALADARLKRKEPPPVEPQSTLSKYRQSIASLFHLENTSSIADGLKANYPKEEPESNTQFADCAKGKSAVSLREWEPLPKSQLTDVCVN